jgi:hypothetical protein
MKREVILRQKMVKLLILIEKVGNALVFRLYIMLPQLSKDFIMPPYHLS